MKKIDLNKHIWEGWTVGMFIDDLEPTIKMLVANKRITSSSEMRKQCNNLQRGYKKDINEVLNYFTHKYL